MGVGAASGLIYNDNSLLIIGDNSGYLYEYLINKTDLKRHGIIEKPSENIAKKDKFDFESQVLVGNDLYIFGSGSGKKRNVVIEMNLKNKDTVASTDLAPLYIAMQKTGKIDASEFNIEGAIFDGTNWLFFNRGKGPSNKNVIFTLKGKSLSGALDITAMDIKLPYINKCRSGFSDAILVGDKIYFLATAENSMAADSSGRILGSLVGCIDKATMKIDFTKKISNHKKFEGLTLYSKKEDKIEFLLCEDNDTALLESNIYKLSLKDKK
jgi:hypothetical protein